VQPGATDLATHGLHPQQAVHWNLSPADLVERTIAKGEGQLTNRGALAILTGERTGRSPKDKFIVKDDMTAETVAWGTVNRPIERAQFDALRDLAIDHLNGQELFVVDAKAGASVDYSISLRLVTTKPAHALFARQLFRRLPREELQGAKPEWIILGAPDCKAEAAKYGINSEAFVLADFARKTIVIGGTAYAGEIKKSIFTVMNYALPARGVFPMHCSANVGPHGDVALFFGLSGTGKTTLSADPDRRLIGDDEHGWSDKGVFNFEGGCYAKCIRLSEKNEPQIYKALRFGCVVENVEVDPDSRITDFDSSRYTENTRAAYPLDFIDNAIDTGRADAHPTAVVFLTCDAFGVLPPISLLTPQQAMYHFLSGYTAKVAGTEAGVTEPQATFSTGFGEPFLPRDPMEYANMLAAKIEQHGSQCYLINTGWQGGGFGVGSRIDLPSTRAMVSAALVGALRGIDTEVDPVFGLRMPKRVTGVDEKLLLPWQTWSERVAYDKAAQHLAGLFKENFTKFATATDEVKAAGPR